MSKSKNYLRSGLKSDKKLKGSFYSFLFEKHFDWAIILAAFFSPLPYISSKIYWFLITKTFIFSAIVYLCLRYIINWKKLKSYYNTHDKAIQITGSMIDKEKLNKSELNTFTNFFENITSEIKSIGKSFIDNKDGLTFQEFIAKFPEKGKPLEDLLNKDFAMTKTTIGMALTSLVSIVHFMGIPQNELNNYRRLLIIILLVVLFFLVYAIEIILL